jgi:hypothetical protein
MLGSAFTSNRILRGRTCQAFLTCLLKNLTRALMARPSTIAAANFPAETGPRPSRVGLTAFSLAVS